MLELQSMSFGSNIKFDEAASEWNQAFLSCCLANTQEPLPPRVNLLTVQQLPFEER